MHEWKTDVKPNMKNLGLFPWSQKETAVKSK